MFPWPESGESLVKWKPARLMKQLERVKELEKQVKREREALEDELDRFEALQADADDAMRAHLINGQEESE